VAIPESDLTGSARQLFCLIGNFPLDTILAHMAISLYQHRRDSMSMTHDQKRRAAASIRDDAKTQIAAIEAEAAAIEAKVLEMATGFGCDALALKIIQDHLTDLRADYRFEDLRSLERNMENSGHVADQSYADFSRDFWTSQI
jgi:hypothetical protein